MFTFLLSPQDLIFLVSLINFLLIIFLLYLVFTLKSQSTRIHQKTLQKALLASLPSSELKSLLLDQFKASLDPVIKDLGIMLDQTQTELTHQTQKLLNQLTSNLHQQAQTTQTHLSDKLTADFDQAQKDFKTYQQKRLELFEDQVTNLVNQTASDMLHQSLSLEQHQYLIDQALDQAAKAKLFK